MEPFFPLKTEIYRSKVVGLFKDVVFIKVFVDRQILGLEYDQKVNQVQGEISFLIYLKRVKKNIQAMYIINVKSGITPTLKVFRLAV